MIAVERTLQSFLRGRFNAFAIMSLEEFDPASMDDMSHGHLVDLSKGTTYYEIHGDSGPWIVCLHGISWWSFIWKDITALLKDKGYRVLIFGEKQDLVDEITQ